MQLQARKPPVLHPGVPCCSPESCLRRRSPQTGMRHLWIDEPRAISIVQRPRAQLCHSLGSRSSQRSESRPRQEQPELFKFGQRRCRPSRSSKSDPKELARTWYWKRQERRKGQVLPQQCHEEVLHAEQGQGGSLPSRPRRSSGSGLECDRLGRRPLESSGDAAASAALAKGEKQQTKKELPRSQLRQRSKSLLEQPKLVRLGSSTPRRACKGCGELPCGQEKDVQKAIASCPQVFERSGAQSGSKRSSLQVIGGRKDSSMGKTEKPAKGSLSHVRDLEVVAEGQDRESLPSTGPLVEGRAPGGHRPGLVGGLDDNPPGRPFLPSSVGWRCDGVGKRDCLPSIDGRVGEVDRKVEISERDLRPEQPVDRQQQPSQEQGQGQGKAAEDASTEKEKA